MIKKKQKKNKAYNKKSYDKRLIFAKSCGNYNSKLIFSRDFLSIKKKI